MALASLEGSEALQKKFASLVDIVDGKQMETALMKPARKLRNAIRNAAPKGPTGNLKKGVVAKRFRRKIKDNPAVFVGMDYRIAPHFHLVEYGTQGRRYPSGKRTIKRGILGFFGIKRAARALHFVIGGKEIFAKYVGPMPAKPFFRPTVDREAGRIIDDIEKQAWKVIEKEANR